MSTLAINHIPALCYFDNEERQPCNRLLLSAVVVSLLIHTATLFYFHNQPTQPLLKNHSTNSQSTKTIIASVNIKKTTQQITEIAVKKQTTPQEKTPPKKSTPKNTTKKPRAAKVEKLVTSNKPSPKKNSTKKTTRTPIENPLPTKITKKLTKNVEKPSLLKSENLVTPQEKSGNILEEKEKNLLEKIETTSFPKNPKAEEKNDGIKNHRLSQDYKSLLMAELDKVKHYPIAAKRRLLEDTVLVKFTINNQGAIIHSSLVKPSAHRLFNKAVERMLKKASPMPAPPTDIVDKEKYLTFQIPIEFSLKH